MVEARDTKGEQSKTGAAPAAPSVPLPDGEGDAASAALRLELSETKESLLRALAEQQNIRRRMQRERDDAVKFAAARLAEDLLDTLDNLRRAIESVPPGTPLHSAADSLLKGVEATEANLLATLARHGVQRIDALGKAFDPHRHHAVRQKEDATAAEGTVVEVMQTGYMLHDRLLRPATVGVATGGA